MSNILGLEKQKTIDELKRVMEQDFQVLKLDNKFHLDFDKEKLYAIRFSKHVHFVCIILFFLKIEYQPNWWTRWKD